MIKTCLAVLVSSSFLTACRPTVQTPPEAAAATRRVDIPPVVTPVVTQAANLPPAVAEFKSHIQGLNAKQVLAAAIAQFGMPTRNAGSGLSIPQWDLPGGRLTVHPLVGPTFAPSIGSKIYLIDTQNPAGKTLLNNMYEMTTPPDPGNHGTRFWIGDVTVSSDLTYQYVDGGQNLSNRGDQSANFFTHHPAGKVAVAWPAGVSAQTPLESAGDRTIADFIFTAEDKSATYQCQVHSSSDARRLEINDPAFAMETGWRQYWNSRKAN